MVSFFLALTAGTVTGILSGFGVGGGSLLLIYMTAIAGIDQRLAQGINLLYFLPAALAALPSHIKNGYVVKETAFPAILSGIPAAILGAWLATGLEVAFLRRCFGGYLLVLGLRELCKK